MKPARMSRNERVARGVSATVIAVVFAAFSHVLAGGTAPSLIGIAVTVLVVLPLSIALAGVRLSLARLATIVVIGQGLFHASFSMIGTSSIPGSSSGIIGSQGGLHASHVGAHDASSAQIAEALALTPTSSSALMWLSHLGAAVVTLWLLRSGERSAVALITTVQAALRALRATIPSPVAFSAVVPAPLPAHPRSEPVQLRLARRALRRGPPTFSA